MQKLSIKGASPKQLISWTVGLPAALIIMSELNDLSLWWIQFLAMGLLLAILKWNGIFSQESYQPKKSNQRRF